MTPPARRGTVRALVKRIVPGRLHFAIGRALRRARYAGLARYCPVCESHVRAFRPHGVRRRADAVCPVCESRERHRLAWLFLRDETDLFSAPHRMLHISPEPEMSRRLARLPLVEYLSADIGSGAMVRADIASMQFPAGRFDIIYCSHVLNMVPDDRPAIAELHRVLAPGGWALLQVPIDGETTSELPPDAGPADRLAAFGDPDIRRVYGRDLGGRLASAGFGVRVVHRFAATSPDDRRRLGLHDEDLFLCTK